MNMKLFIHLSIALIIFTGTVPAQPFTIDHGQFLLHDKPFQMMSGEMHYARIPPEYWRQRLMMAKSMGLNTVSTYVFWNLHEPKRGEFTFSGIADIAKFVKIAQEVGLYVILRPGPYVCAEWEFGGYPSWLLKDHDLIVRKNDRKFLDACENYLVRLGKELAPLQITHGGPIIMVQVENEYGSYGDDTLYVGKIRDMILKAGFDVPLFSADGPSQMHNAVVSGVLPAVNGAVGEEVFSAIKNFHPEGPFFVPEYYPGWLDHWGEQHAHTDAHTNAAEIDSMLKLGISVNLYMFHGGTNFGFMNGANDGGTFQPQPTSYDYDAPLDEAGRPTQKYYALREIYLRHQPAGTTVPDVPPANPVISIPRFVLNETMSLFDKLPKPVSSLKPLSMEDVGQSYGYILYRTQLTERDSGLLVLKNLCDYGIVFLNGTKIASLDRRHRQHSVKLNVKKNPSDLDILVENEGRINYGEDLPDNRKGITEKVLLNGKELTDWQIYSLPLDDISSLSFSSKENVSAPVVRHGTFSLDRVGDTFFDMHGWGKGAIWVNGHNAGRFWYIGPQQTLYIPGVWLHQGLNDVVVLDIENDSAKSIEGLPEPILNTLVEDKLAPPRPVRRKGIIQLTADKIVKEGTFVPGSAAQVVMFVPVHGRFVCLQSLSSLNNDPFASIAELNLTDDHGNILPRDTWKIYYVDSEELDAEDGQAENIFDDDPATIWHTQWSAQQPAHPHEIAIDLGDEYVIGGFQYLPRAQNRPGKIQSYKFFVQQKPFAITSP